MAQAIQKEMKMWETTQYVQDFKTYWNFCGIDPHLVLMDITLPFYNGTYWCSEIRKISNVPVIFISSAADNRTHHGCEYGRWFCSKPSQCADGEGQAVLRRTYDLSGKYRFLSIREQYWANDASALIMGEDRSYENEFRILQTLAMENKGRLVSRYFDDPAVGDG